MLKTMNDSDIRGVLHLRPDEEIEEGFWKSRANHEIFYLSKEGNDWYFQFYWNPKPIIIDSGKNFYVEKVNPKRVLKELEKEREFIESKLASLTEKTS